LIFADTSFCCFSKILTVADDCMMKVFTVESIDGEKQLGLTEETLIDLDGETYSLCSNQVDKLAFGGDDKRAYI